jgi:hypothetical protein
MARLKLLIINQFAFDLYGELSTGTINLFDRIASFAAAPKGITPFYYLNRFYNNLLFVFANKNSNIISSYIAIRSRNLPNSIFPP